MPSLLPHFENKRVLVTGHTGFKGSWLCEWLLMLGARVTGFSLPPPTSPALFDQLCLASRMEHRVGDIRDGEALRRIVDEARPDYIFHLAAQPLVRLSYREPVETYATNVMGTVHLLDAVRAIGRSTIVLCITTDKCYENKEWLHGYREEDPLGGYDPYSSSKAAAEIAIGAYRSSFFPPQKFNSRDAFIAVASARAGNVIGGGDWALDRIVPDCIRSLMNGEPVPVRNLHATRPWQHVLEPLSGYLTLAAQIDAALDSSAPAAAVRSQLARLCGPFNFGPSLSSNRSVRSLVEELLRHWPGSWKDASDPDAVHEASLLNLATDKAHHLLGWRPRWDFERTIGETACWYKEAAQAGIPEYTQQQILHYMQAMCE